jgi:hypothetical protein
MTADRNEVQEGLRPFDDVGSEAEGCNASVQ